MSSYVLPRGLVPGQAGQANTVMSYLPKRPAVGGCGGRVGFAREMRAGRGENSDTTQGASAKGTCYLPAVGGACHLEAILPPCSQLLEVHAIYLATSWRCMPSCHHHRQPPPPAVGGVRHLFFLLKGQQPSALVAASRDSVFFMGEEQQRRGKGCCGAGKNNFGWGFCWLLLCSSISSGDSSETCQSTIASR